MLYVVDAQHFHLIRHNFDAEIHSIMPNLVFHFTATQPLHNLHDLFHFVWGKQTIHFRRILLKCSPTSNLLSISDWNNFKGEENLADLIRYAKFNLTTNTSECLLDLLRVMLLICFENFTNLFPSLMKIPPENSINERDETFPMLSGLKVEYSIISFRVAPNWLMALPGVMLRC